MTRRDIGTIAANGDIKFIVSTIFEQSGYILARKINQSKRGYAAYRYFVPSQKSLCSVPEKKEKVPFRSKENIDVGDVGENHRRISIRRRFQKTSDKNSGEDSSGNFRLILCTITIHGKNFREKITFHSSTKKNPIFASFFGQSSCRECPFQKENKHFVLPNPNRVYFYFIRSYSDAF